MGGVIIGSKVGLVEPAGGGGAVGDGKAAGVGRKVALDEVNPEGDDGGDEFEGVEGDAVTEVGRNFPAPGAAVGIKTANAVLAGISAGTVGGSAVGNIVDTDAFVGLAEEEVDINHFDYYV